MEHLNFSSKLKLRYKNISPFLFCTVTFLGPAQRSKPGSAFAKAGPDGKNSAMAHMKEMLTLLVTCLSPRRNAINPKLLLLRFVVDKMAL